MANITEVSQWENVIRQLENGEAATGGADGLANIQAKQLANRTKYLKDNYLPLAGGAISGNITKNVDNSTLLLCGGTGYKKGGTISIGGSGITDAGKVWIEACDGTNSCNLNALPNGNLTWNSNDLAGSAIVAKSLGDLGSYVKYASGLIIQWGYSDNPKKISFPISFSNTNYGLSVIAQSVDGLQGTIPLINASEIKKNSVTLWQNPAGAAWVHWFAIGR